MWADLFPRSGECLVTRCWVSTRCYNPTRRYHSKRTPLYRVSYTPFPHRVHLTLRSPPPFPHFPLPPAAHNFINHFFANRVFYLYHFEKKSLSALLRKTLQPVLQDYPYFPFLFYCQSRISGNDGQSRFRRIVKSFNETLNFLLFTWVLRVRNLISSPQRFYPTNTRSLDLRLNTTVTMRENQLPQKNLKVRL